MYDAVPRCMADCPGTTCCRHLQSDALLALLSPWGLYAMMVLL